jgi:hypothetical protein
MIERLETLAPGGLSGHHLLLDADAIRAAEERPVIR